MEVYKDYNLNCIECNRLSNNSIELIAHKNAMAEQSVEPKTRIDICEDCIREAYGRLMGEGESNE